MHCTAYGIDGQVGPCANDSAAWAALHGPPAGVRRQLSLGPVPDSEFRTSQFRPLTTLSGNLLIVKHLCCSCCGHSWTGSERPVNLTVTMNGWIPPSPPSDLPHASDLQPAHHVPEEQSVLGLRDPPARSWRQGRVWRRLCRPVLAAQNSDTPKSTDVRNSGTWLASRSGYRLRRGAPCQEHGANATEMSCVCRPWCRHPMRPFRAACARSPQSRWCPGCKPTGASCLKAAPETLPATARDAPPLLRLMGSAPLQRPPAFPVQRRVQALTVAGAVVVSDWPRRARPVGCF